MKLDTATALVTGANRGIGHSLVSALLDAGVDKVYALVRTQASAQELAGAGSRIVPLVADIADRDAVARLTGTAPDVNLLINNAGVLDFGSFLDTGREQIERNFATNFYGTLNMIETFAPILSDNGGGTIVNLLTLVALASMPSLSVYNASKAAAWSMTQSLRASLADRHIRMMGVFPGAVDTDMLKGVDMPKTPPADIAAAIIEGLKVDAEDVFPDTMSQSVYADWKKDHKAVERQFAAM